MIFIAVQRRPKDISNDLLPILCSLEYALVFILALKCQYVYTYNSIMFDYKHLSGCDCDDAGPTSMIMINR